MNIEKAILYALMQYPEKYLVAEPSLYIEATNRAANAFTLAEMQQELNTLESARLVIGQRVHSELKWKITGAGRAWLKES